MLRISKDDTNIVEKAVAIFQKGGIIVYPTETCYGIGVDATNQIAVDKLLEYKTRPEGKPISIAVSDAEMARKYVDVNEIAENIYQNYLPGPITVVSKGRHQVAAGIESEYGTLGIRIPDYPLVLEIIKRLGRPITSTSANVSYEKRPYSIDGLVDSTPEKKLELIDLAIDAGELPKRKTSTVLDTTLNTMNVLRQGKIEFEKAGKQILTAHTKSAQETADFGSTLLLKYIDELQTKCLVIALGGELGTGKTQLTKGLALKLGIKQTVKSPTYTLISEYPYSVGRSTGKLIHIDTWRLGETGELKSLQLQNFIKPGNVVVIEWADKYFSEIANLASKPDTIFLKVALEHTGDELRFISVEQS